MECDFSVYCEDGFSYSESMTAAIEMGAGVALWPIFAAILRDAVEDDRSSG